MKKKVVLYGPTNPTRPTYGRGVDHRRHDCLCFSPVCTQKIHCLTTISARQAMDTYLALTRTGPAGKGPARKAKRTA